MAKPKRREAFAAAKQKAEAKRAKPTDLRSILAKEFPNMNPDRFAVEDGAIVHQAESPQAIGFRIDLSGDKPVVTAIGGKDRQISNFLTQRYGAILKKHPNLRELIGAEKPAAPAPAPEPVAPAVEAPKPVTPLTREEWLTQVGDYKQTRAEAEALMTEAQRLNDTIKGQLYPADKKTLRKNPLPEALRVMQQVNELRSQAGKIKDRAYAQQRMHDDPHSQMRPRQAPPATQYEEQFGRDEARAAAALKEWEAAQPKPAPGPITPAGARWYLSCSAQRVPAWKIPTGGGTSPKRS